MTRARLPRPHEVQAARRDPRFLRAREVTVDDPTWRTAGRCRTVDPETFFDDAVQDMAQALCRGCDVQADCLATALQIRADDGVWGATTPRERRAMLVAWRTQRAGVPR